MSQDDDILLRFPAPPALAAHVFGFVRRKDRRGGQVVRILPETRASIQIFRTEPYWLKEDAPGAAWREAPRIGLWGPRFVPAFGFVERSHDVFAVGLTPAGVRALTGKPAGTFANDAVSPPSLPALRSLFETALEPETRFEDWMDAAKTTFAAILERSPPPAPIERGVEALATEDGSIAEAALALGLSDRHFRRLFSAEHGAAPKTYARLLRFDAVLKALHPRPWEKKPDLIPPYADQSHLIREFCEFARITPAAYVRSKQRHGDTVLRSIVVEDVAPPEPRTRDA
jgi:AraC-like DNA-binding protein